MFDKKQKRCVKCIHLVTDDDLYDQEAFYKIKLFSYSSSTNGLILNEVWIGIGIASVTLIYETNRTN